MHQINPSDAMSGLVGHRFESLTRREYDWSIQLDRDARIVIGCLWRLLHEGRICRTSDDDGHKFGHPAPVDSVAEVNNHITGLLITRVELVEGSLDLFLTFENGDVLQIIPISSGYEAWTAYLNETYRIIAIGGGDLSVWIPR